MANRTVWWVGDPGDPGDYEAQYREASPKFATRALAEAWKDREERQAYARRLESRAEMVATYERWLAEAGDDERLRDLAARSLEQARADNELLARISLADWLTSTQRIVVGGWHNHYQIDSEEVLEALD